MDMSPTKNRRVALTALALALVVLAAWAATVAGAAQQPVRPEQGGRVVVTAPASQSGGEGVVADASQNRGDGTGTTDGDPDIPMDRPQTLVELLLIQRMVFLAALGF